jgi:hypothetical protein
MPILNRTTRLTLLPILNRTTKLTLILAVAVGWLCGAHDAPALARSTVLNETGRLHLTSKHNFTLNEQGTATGTAAGTIYVHLTATSSTRVTVEVNIYPHGGSLTGHGVASYRRSAGAAEFSGAMSIDRGTGSYAGVHGSGLSFSGTIAESHGDAITVHVSGRVSS